MELGSSASSGSALPPVVEAPEGIAPEALELGLRALAHVPAAPRTPTGRMRAEQLSLFRGTRGILMGCAGLFAFLAVCAFFGRSDDAFLPLLVAALVCVAIAAWKRMGSARLLARGLATLGRIDAIRIREVQGPGSGTDSAFVSYTFLVRAEQHRGTAMIDVSDAKELARAGVVPVLYDPANPSRSVPWLGALDVR